MDYGGNDVTMDHFSVFCWGGMVGLNPVVNDCTKSMRVPIYFYILRVMGVMGSLNFGMRRILQPRIWEECLNNCKLWNDFDRYFMSVIHVRHLLRRLIRKRNTKRVIWECWEEVCIGLAVRWNRKKIMHIIRNRILVIRSWIGWWIWRMRIWKRRNNVERYGEDEYQGGHGGFHVQLAGYIKAWS